MASCLQNIPSGNKSRAEGENDEMPIPNYRERSRLNKCFINNTVNLPNWLDLRLANYTSLEIVGCSKSNFSYLLSNFSH